jgi:hypothetical protein
LPTGRLAAERLCHWLAAMSIGLIAAATAVGRAPAAQLQQVKVGEEVFAAFVPASPPAQGYGLLVFIPPWNEAKLPRGWGPVLARNQMIFATAANSGNSAGIAGRREQLALLAAGAMRERYPVNPARLYVGGFSGGSRIAIRVAVAHADLFRGALLNAGSDSLGEADFALPAPQVLARVQESSRFVYLTGENDVINVDKDAQSADSLQRRCIFATTIDVIPWTGHEVADPGAFAHALTELQKPVAGEGQKLRACRERLAASH